MESLTAPSFDGAFRKQLGELFRFRRDVRHFRRDPVPLEMVEHLLELANLAPSVGLSQPWRFVIVDDPDRRAQVRANFERCNAKALASQTADRANDYSKLKLAGLDDAPCHLAVFAEPEPQQGGGLGQKTMPETIAYSAVMAVHTLWLAARALELGVGWVSILDPEAVARTLDVPLHWKFIGYLCLGYPGNVGQTPELERRGWEFRRPVDCRIMRR